MTGKKGRSGRRDHLSRGGGRPSTRIKIDVGRELRAALSVMALQDAIAAQIEQDDAEALLIARLIQEERQRRLETTS